MSYSAPEIITDQQNLLTDTPITETATESSERQYTEKAETWSLGCCLYYLASKVDPFEGATVKDTKQNILKLKLNIPNKPIDPVVN